MADPPPRLDPNPNDVTANVPTEVLCLVFSYVSSFRDKFSLAAVNAKFRGCVMKEMNKPAPLDVQIVSVHRSSRLYCSFNGTIIRMYCRKFFPIDPRFDYAVQALVEACKFSKITIDVGGVHSGHQHGLFEILSDTDCLDQLTRFEATGGDGSSSDFAKALASCDKLSVLELRLSINFDQHFTEALRNKRLTELVLKLDICTQQQVIELFQALKPNTLRKLQLTRDRWARKHDPLAFSELVEQLSSSWMALEVVRFDGWSRLPSPELPRLFEAVASLPSLQLCHINWFLVDLGPQNEFIATLAALLDLSGVEKNLTLKLNEEATRNKRGCWFAGVIDAVKERHPHLRMELTLSYLKLYLGAVFLFMSVGEWGTECPNNACVVPCKNFYPNVIRRLVRRASAKTNGHLENYRLDRCRVERVVGDYNALNQWNSIRATEVFEQLEPVMVMFEAADRSFYITINTRHCDIACIKCVPN